MMLEMVMIWFSCVCANHLGLVSAIEKVIGHPLPIVNCSKCFSFWALMAYGINENENFFTTISTSFLFSYAATWLELLMGYIDTIFYRLYEKIYPETNDDTAPTDERNRDSASALSEL